MQIIHQEPTQLVVRISALLYSREVVLKSVYWLADTVTTQLDWQKETQAFELTMTAIDSSGPLPDWQLLLTRLDTLLVDYATRQLVQEQTRDVRTILLAKAFSQSDELDAVPPGSAGYPL